MSQAQQSTPRDSDMSTANSTNALLPPETFAPTGKAKPPRPDPQTCPTCGRRCLSVCFECERAKREGAVEQVAVDPRETIWQNMWEAGYHETAVPRLPYPSALTRAMDWLYDEAAKPGLLLHGPTGAGKTRTAYLVLRQMFDSGLDVRLFMAGQFGDTVGKVYRDGGGAEWVRDVVEYPVVLLDDLGNGMVTDRTAETLLAIIEHRMAAKKATIITTQYLGSMLSSKCGAVIGAAILRRLYDGYVAISMGRTKSEKEKP